MEHLDRASLTYLFGLPPMILTNDPKRMQELLNMACSRYLLLNFPLPTAVIIDDMMLSIEAFRVRVSHFFPAKKS
jgi:hypothetical protein